MVSVEFEFFCKAFFFVMSWNLQNCVYILFFLLIESANTAVTHGFYLKDILWILF